MTVTLYQRRDGGWRRTVLEGAYLCRAGGVSHRDGFSRSDTAEGLLILPWREIPEPRPGDGIFPGEGPELGAGPLKALLPEALIAGEVSRLRCGSKLDHWEVLLR